MMAKRESADYPRKSSTSASSLDEIQNPEDKLMRLKADLKACQDKISAKTKELEALTEGIGLLEGLVKEINQSSTAYGELHKTSLDGGSKSLAQYSENKTKMIDAALPADDRKEIDKVIKEVAEEIKEKESQVASLEEALTGATAGFESGNARVEAARKDYDAIQGYPKRIQKLLADANGLRTEIESREEGDEYKKMYVLLASLKWAVSQAEVKTVEKYKDELRTAATALHEATQWRDEQEQKMDQAQAEADDAREELANLKQNKNATILHRLGEGETPSSKRHTAPAPVERTARGREPKRGG